MKRHHGLTDGMKLISLKITTKVRGEKMSNIKDVPLAIYSIFA